MEERITIRPLETQGEFRACHTVQREAWAFPDLLIIPYTQLITIHHNGGAVLGAFDGARLVGFVYGFLAQQGNQPLYLFSQRMGVLPSHQGQGVGEHLKWAQRAWAQDRGLERIVWTYDPLETPNANLNIAKLGGLVRRYERDIYGQHDSPLHRDLPTDRFVVEWELSSRRVLDRLAPGWAAPRAEEFVALAGAPLNTVAPNERGLPACRDLDLERTGPVLLMEVPADWQGLRRADMELARRWRAQTRRAFERLLERGYEVTGYARSRAAERSRNLYLLERAEQRQ